MRRLFIAMGLVSFVFLSLVSVGYSVCEGDLNCDGDVDGSDLADFAADFGRTDCPLAGPAPVEKTGQTKCYDTTGEIPCVGGTGQDGDLQKGVAWPNPRFTINGDGTVTDNLTGLIWLQDAARGGEMIWYDALTYCNNLADDGVNLTDGSSPGDWRLPNLKELLSLIHYGVYSPALSNTAGTGKWSENDPFTGVHTSRYWSASTGADLGYVAWYVGMYRGYVGSNEKSSTYYVWPVRGGQ